MTARHGYIHGGLGAALSGSQILGEGLISGVAATAHADPKGCAPPRS